MKIGLKLCPFCGGEAEFHQFAHPKNYFTVRCTACQCQTHGYNCKIDATASENKTMQAEIWNRRQLTNANEENDRS